MKGIFGLGNPGSAYRRTRHNVGFAAVDALAARFRMEGWNRKFKSLVACGTIGGEKVILAKPQTYMNLSGEAVGLIKGFYKLENTDLMVVVDDVNLPPGRIRIRPDGTAGGHNGLKDVERALGTAAYPRLRIGVGAPAGAEGGLTDHVLGSPTDDEAEAIGEGITYAVAALAEWIGGDIEKVMNIFNAKEI